MATLDAAAAVVTIIGLPIVIIALVYQALQYRDLKHQLRIQAYQAVYDSTIQVDQFLIEHPELRRKLYGSGSDTDLGDRAQTDGACEMMLDLFEKVTGCRAVFSPEKWAGWRNYMQMLYRESSSLREYVERSKGWYTPELITLLQSGASPVTTGGNPSHREDGTPAL